MNRFAAITFIAFVAFCTSALSAKSIFDEDFPSAPAPKHETARPPLKVDPSDTPAPEPAPPVLPESTSPTATPPPVVEESNAPKEKDARVKAELDLSAAKANAEKRAGADPDYVKATEAVDVARKAYEASKVSGSIEEKAAAFSAMSQAIANKDSLHKRLMDSDGAYQTAKKNAAQYGAPPSPVLTQKEVVSPEIAEAIASHNFVEGMTVRQARQAARLQSELVHASGTTKTYRWYVKGRTGTFTTVTERSYGRMVQHQVPDFGVIAYVEGNFVDDKLATFARYSLLARKSDGFGDADGNAPLYNPQK